MQQMKLGIITLSCAFDSSARYSGFQTYSASSACTYSFPVTEAVMAVEVFVHTHVIIPYFHVLQLYEINLFRGVTSEGHGVHVHPPKNLT